MLSHKITIVGTGYVGLSLATLLARYHNIGALDINASRVDQINNRLSPITDRNIAAVFSSMLDEMTPIV
jgi:UDPglucose 6-dehydrogenase